MARRISLSVLNVLFKKSQKRSVERVAESGMDEISLSTERKIFLSFCENESTENKNSMIMRKTPEGFI
jgi:hypothetical protein